MAFTPLHRALGILPSDLTMDVVVAAVAAGVREQSDLDWKQKLPDARDQGAKDEFAKDVTAMVNSGGGLIVFGVAENSSTSAAEQIFGTGPWTDSEERRLRAIVYSSIQPAIQNLQFVAVTADTSTVVLLHVPASAETPHFHVRQGSLRAPRRYGAQTVDMSERDIEQAYRARFEDRRVRDTTLSRLTERIMVGLPRSRKVWMTAAAVPLNPRPAHLSRLPRDLAFDVFQDMQLRSPYLESQNEHLFGYLNPNPRPGLRKWRATMAWDGDVGGVVEVHDNGAAVMAWAPRTVPGFDAGSDVHVMHAHHFPAYVMQFLGAAADRLDVFGGYQVQIMFHGADDNEAIYIRTYDHGFAIDKENLFAIHRFAPVEFLVAEGSSNERLEVVHSMALDILNQASVGIIDTKYLRPVAPIRNSGG